MNKDHHLSFGMVWYGMNMAWGTKIRKRNWKSVYELRWVWTITCCSRVGCWSWHGYFSPLLREESRRRSPASFLTISLSFTTTTPATTWHQLQLRSQPTATPWTYYKLGHLHYINRLRSFQEHDHHHELGSFIPPGNECWRMRMKWNEEGKSQSHYATHGMASQTKRSQVEVSLLLWK